MIIYPLYNHYIYNDYKHDNIPKLSNKSGGLKISIRVTQNSYISIKNIKWKLTSAVSTGEGSERCSGLATPAARRIRHKAETQRGTPLPTGGRATRTP